MVLVDVDLHHMRRLDGRLDRRGACFAQLRVFVVPLLLALALFRLLLFSPAPSPACACARTLARINQPPDPLPQGIASPPGTGKPPPPQPPTTSLVSAGTHASNSSHHTAATGERVYLPAQRLNVSAVMPTGASADADAAKPVKTAGGRKSAVASRNLAMPSSPVAVN